MPADSGSAGAAALAPMPSPASAPVAAAEAAVQSGAEGAHVPSAGAGGGGDLGDVGEGSAAPSPHPPQAHRDYGGGGGAEAWGDDGDGRCEDGGSGGDGDADDDDDAGLGGLEGLEDVLGDLSATWGGLGDASTPTALLPTPAPIAPALAVVDNAPGRPHPHTTTHPAPPPQPPHVPQPQPAPQPLPSLRAAPPPAPSGGDHLGSTGCPGTTPAAAGSGPESLPGSAVEGTGAATGDARPAATQGPGAVMGGGGEEGTRGMREEGMDGEFMRRSEDSEGSEEGVGEGGPAPPPRHVVVLQQAAAEEAALMHGGWGVGVEGADGVGRHWQAVVQDTSPHYAPCLRTTEPRPCLQPTLRSPQGCKVAPALTCSPGTLVLTKCAHTCFLYSPTSPLPHLRTAAAAGGARAPLPPSQELDGLLAGCAGEWPAAGRPDAAGGGWPGRGWRFV